ncbi:DUF6950 family protein [Paracoccus siganidrum]|uniref:DUF6950 domain-containing protein n=2 Tax=Paracoccus siganidrum TaxID=1276757 RepID=A0A419A3V0_9RHOB|nr:hypothetical protein [Paracoccus siganidrum]RJL08407.1 hypothetical protein D3P05_16180 [Paracoccus siganidrum]RMC39433.1 hypothetical protein C9E82_04890 [Paracoccus siganidrum]
MTTPDLGAYVQRTAALPWCWGVQDCTIWAADWCLIRWGVDPAARYRGRYHDEAGALALTRAGLLATVGPEIPLRRKDAPAEGDIGVIEINGRQVAAIWSGAHWLFRTPRGIGMTSRAAIAIWGD